MIKLCFYFAPFLIVLCLMVIVGLLAMGQRGRLDNLFSLILKSQLGMSKFIHHARLSVNVLVCVSLLLLRFPVRHYGFVTKFLCLLFFSSSSCLSVQFV